MKIALPVLGPPDKSRQLLELHSAVSDDWERWKIIGHAVDGRVKLEKQSDSREVRWADLSRLRYRWIL